MSGIRYMPIGSNWGHLEVVRAYKADAQNGAVVDLQGGPLTWVLVCDCGRRFEIEAARFPGKRKLRSCGDPECPWSQPQQPKAAAGRALGRPRNAETCAALSLYLPVAVIGMLETWGKRRGVSVGLAAAELIRAGFAERMDGDEETKEQEVAAWDENTGMRGQR